MSVTTRGQTMAQAAFSCIDKREKAKPDDRKEYRSFAREFPTLVHQCGLAQAVAFAIAKKGQQANYVDDLASILKKAGHAKIDDAKKLDEEARTAQLAQYVRLSRDALLVAVWLKRYVEALFPDEPKKEGGI